MAKTEGKAPEGQDKKEMVKKMMQDPRFLAAAYRNNQKRVDLVDDELVRVKANANELTATVKGLERLQQEKDSPTTLIPLRSGVLVEAKLADKDNVYVDIGNGVVVKKKVEDAVKTLNERKEKLVELGAKLNKERANLQKGLMVLQKTFKAGAAKAKAKKAEKKSE